MTAGLDDPEQHEPVPHPELTVAETRYVLQSVWRSEQPLRFETAARPLQPSEY